MISDDVASNMLATSSSTRILNPPSLSSVTFGDLASSIFEALVALNSKLKTLNPKLGSNVCEALVGGHDADAVPPAAEPRGDGAGRTGRGAPRAQGAAQGRAWPNCVTLNPRP